MKFKVMVVDDDELFNKSISQVLTDSGYDVISYFSGEMAIKNLREDQPDIVLLDIFLKDENGLDILKRIKDEEPMLPVLMITAYSDVSLVVQAIKLGADDFILKPLDFEQLEIAMQKAVKNLKLQREIQILKERLSEQFGEYKIIGQSKGIIEALSLAEKYALGDDTTVLISGETGTGKELIARYIHEKSSRREGPFIAINCGAIPKDLIESELFGYERGAFTGATDKMKPGKFELANGGTILLDEVGELSPEAQVKLLRVLQDKKFYRLGGTKEIKVDVRVIASTNKNLKEEVNAGRFRSDLFYRLNVATIYLPPLRERKEDIPLLIDAFIDEFNKKFSKNFIGVDEKAMEILKSYHWPGNIRELRNTIERIILVENDSKIRPEHVKHLQSTPIQLVSQQNGESDFVLKIPPTGVTMDKVLRELIIQTLKITNGNQIQAAKILGITRSKLRYRMEQLKIEQKKILK
ncbi:DNA-binding transcriptional response regulator, NtrC family, contains REC, AAA-type ATPase, and a Fis-type DNA-binding domains [Candidatus Thermokryptus mobilis]|uniref:DNA-binding transcriptional response regulator, NtrC family, contains REC, AAA-type ATPase, and a Fis-type DNA-binding domains n=1 Tax=Candidatus Thermokryptus mobilis TaxID=1643428 RepID=A0A0S4N5A9_9BACT|nr:sigma-54 dependent transcriptional regulator [Candidatus Thermokryptus mobilis]CUU06059.1 DNA-binding transcriptional response regulator, NtrC family, contains REC, AAA-type ATPase, and a Fis-type DNA-binding domains [Candidatus Thermokryptus mobilis]